MARFGHGDGGLVEAAGAVELEILFVFYLFVKRKCGVPNQFLSPTAPVGGLCHYYLFIIVQLSKATSHSCRLPSKVQAMRHAETVA